MGRPRLAKEVEQVSVAYESWEEVPQMGQVCGS